MDLMQMRRRLLMQSADKYAIGTLKYWWSGKTEPSGSSWYYKKPNTRRWTLSGNTYDAASKAYVLNANNYGYIIPTNNNLDLGNHWRLTFTTDIKLDRKTSQIFLDLASVKTANKAIGFNASFNTSYNKNVFSINWKMLGNNSNPGVIIETGLIIPQDDDYHVFNGYYEIVDGGDGYDRFNVCINGNIYNCAVQIPQVYYGPPWDSASFYLGRAFIASHSVGGIKIYDMRIYQID